MHQTAQAAVMGSSVIQFTSASDDNGDDEPDRGGGGEDCSECQSEAKGFQGVRQGGSARPKGVVRHNETPVMVAFYVSDVLDMTGNDGVVSRMSAADKDD
jgi:hypothetical protein